jgi:prevent-host-death family protein
MKLVTSTEANRDFSKLLQGVVRGEVVQITSRGKPVAVMAPIDARRPSARMALAQLLERLDGQAMLAQPVDRRDWTRDELYR